MSAPTKVPAAVVYLERPDGRVLALTRGSDFADWHLPGGKWEPRDGEAGNVLDSGAIATGPNLRRTAWRELHEETGLRLDASAGLRAIADYTTRSGRPVRLFVAAPPPWAPAEHGPQGDQGLALEGARAHGKHLDRHPGRLSRRPAGELDDRLGRAPSVFPAQAAAERESREDGGGP